MIDISSFHGEIPKVSDKLLPENYASSAVNCDLQEGQLKPTKIATSEQDVEAGAESIYRIGEQWLQWNNKINVVTSLVYNSGGRIIYTGDVYPQETNVDLGIGVSAPYPTASRRLGIVAPTTKLTSAIETAGSSSETRDTSYVFTRVGEWEDGTIVESAPSLASTVTNYKIDDEINLTGFTDDTSDGAYTTHYYIYRINTGNTGAEYQYVAKILTTTNPLEYDDSVADDDLGEVLPTTGWTVPIEDLKGIITASNGLLFAFDDNTVYVSETFITYAFPSAYEIPVESEIVGLGYSGNAVVVLTKTRPYMIYGTDPASLSIEQTPFDLPCKSARSIVSIPSGVIYASTTGLVLVDSGGNADTLTKDIYTKEQWEALSPENIFAFYYNDAYVAFFDGTTQGIEFKPGDSGIRRFTAQDTLLGGKYVSTVSINVYNLLTSAGDNFITDDGYQFVITGSEYSITYDTLYLIQQKDAVREIVAWESGALQDLTWASKEFSFTSQKVFTAGMVVGDFTEGDLSLSLYIDDRLSFSKTISNEDVFRITNPKRGTLFKVVLSGKTTVDRVLIGQSVDEVVTAYGK